MSKQNCEECDDNIIELACDCDEVKSDSCETERIIREIERDMPALSYDIIEGNLKHLQGQVLTLVEATLPTSQQKATKDIIKSFFNAKLTHLFDMYGENGIPDYSDVEFENI